MKNNTVFYRFALLTLLALSCSALNATQLLQLADNRVLPLQPAPPLQPMKPLTPNPPITPQPFKPSTPSTGNQQSTSNNNQNTNNASDNQDSQRIFNNNQGVIYYNNPPYYYYGVSPTVGTYYNSYVVTTPSGSTVVSQGTWVEARDGAIPDRAISYVNKAGLIAYHCRALYHDRMYYGEIVGGQYCVYRDETTTLELRTYEVQVEN